MPSITNTRIEIETKLQIPSSTDPSMLYPDHIMGAAIFDLNGLPKEYYTTAESDNMSWVQTIFQALGLRSLLMSSLRLEGFHHVTIRGSEYCAVVVKQKAHYIALLLDKQDNVDHAFISWLQNFQPSELKQNPRFRVA
jgi:predicted regulator of Ras-like GTPase activity (Roadblock/LC7/MglB family)